MQMMDSLHRNNLLFCKMKEKKERIKDTQLLWKKFPVLKILLTTEERHGKVIKVVNLFYNHHLFIDWLHSFSHFVILFFNWIYQFSAALDKLIIVCVHTKHTHCTLSFNDVFPIEEIDENNFFFICELGIGFWTGWNS